MPHFCGGRSFRSALWLAYLCHVDLMTGQLTNLWLHHVTYHDFVPVSSTPNDDLWLIGGVACFVTSFVKNGVLQLASVCSYLEHRQIVRPTPSLFKVRDVNEIGLKKD